MPAFEGFSPITQAEYERGLSTRVYEHDLVADGLYTARFSLKKGQVEAVSNPVRVTDVTVPHKLGGYGIRLAILTADLQVAHQSEGRMENGLWAADQGLAFTTPISAEVTQAYLMSYEDLFLPAWFLAESKPRELAGSIA